MKDNAEKDDVKDGINKARRKLIAGLATMAVIAPIAGYEINREDRQRAIPLARKFRDAFKSGGDMKKALEVMREAGGDSGVIKAIVAELSAEKMQGRQ